MGAVTTPRTKTEHRKGTNPEDSVLALMVGLIGESKVIASRMAGKFCGRSVIVEISRNLSCGLVEDATYGETLCYGNHPLGCKGKR